jgi:hypothetical protein
VPGRRVDLFQDNSAAGADQPQVGRHLLLAATERGELEAGVHQVEPGGLQLADEQVVVDQRHVVKAFVGHQLLGGGQHRLIDVGPHDLPVGADPVAEQPQPAQRAAADVQDPGSLALADLAEQASAGWFPHPRLELKPLQLGGVIG